MSVATVLASWWTALRSLVMGHDDYEPEQVYDGKQKVNDPATVAWRRMRSEQIRQWRRDERGKLFDPHRLTSPRPRIRLMVAGRGHMKRVDTGGYSLEQYPFHAKGAPVQLANAVIEATRIVDAELVRDEMARARKAEAERVARVARQREAAEAAFERAVQKERADLARKERHAK